MPNTPEIWNFSYENILSIKQKGCTVRNFDARLSVVENEVYQIITEDSELNIPEATLSYIKGCMGRNAEGLTNVEIVSRFLNITDSILQNDMRYDIPSYMMDIPRSFYKAKLYVDNMIFPLIVGKVAEFYRDDMKRYLFESQYVDIEAIYDEDKLIYFETRYHILDKHVSERLLHFNLVKKCLYADTIRVTVENPSGLQIIFPSGNPKEMWESNEHAKTMFEFWLSGMKKLKAIEEYYEIEFELQPVSGSRGLNDLYEAIDVVYDGMMLQENCEITLSGNLFEEDFEIEEPILLEENQAIPLKDRVIQGFVFRAYRSTVLPGKVIFAGKSEDDTVRIPGCCEYKIVEG